MKTLFRLFGTSCIVYILGCAGGTDTDALDFYGALARTLFRLYSARYALPRQIYAQSAKGQKRLRQDAEMSAAGKMLL